MLRYYFRVGGRKARPIYNVPQTPSEEGPTQLSPPQESVNTQVAEARHASCLMSLMAAVAENTDSVPFPVL